MRLLQIVLVGAAAGIVSGVVTLMIELAVLMTRAGDGSAGLGAVSSISWAPVTTLVGFLLGALWQYRRSS